jgi:hypothetical protein
MNHSLPNLFLPIATSLGYWLIRRGLSGARVALKWAAGKAWPLALLLILSTNRASAGWFTRGPDPKTEAANKVLERAAQIAAEAASTQVTQHVKLLEAVEALSSERTNLAKHLEHLGTLASRDSAWAAALQAAAPLLVAVAVLALGCAAIWLVTRSGSQDAELAAVLVDEITGTGAGILVPEASPHQPRYGFPTGIEATSPDHTHQTLHPDTQLDNQEGELPF